jgi:hypothetical protein
MGIGPMLYADWLGGRSISCRPNTPRWVARRQVRAGTNAPRWLARRQVHVVLAPMLRADWLDGRSISCSPWKGPYILHLYTGKWMGIVPMLLADWLDGRSKSCWHQCCALIGYTAGPCRAGPEKEGSEQGDFDLTHSLYVFLNYFHSGGKYVCSTIFCAPAAWWYIFHTTYWDVRSYAVWCILCQPLSSIVSSSSGIEPKDGRSVLLTRTQLSSLQWIGETRDAIFSASVIYFNV